MPLTAETIYGDEVFAPDLTNKNQKFVCRNCQTPMSFVDATLKTKHFRHKVATSSCVYDEPDTETHRYYVTHVYERLKALGLGMVLPPEHPVGKFVVDVFWDRGAFFLDNVAFEIQATNYSFSKYADKIRGYAFRNLLVVYIFVGDDFCREVKPNIYSLKEIEKRIFVEKTYHDTVIGCYLDGNTVTIPLFTPKFAKGSDDYCTHRFIMRYQGTRRTTLDKYLEELKNKMAVRRFWPECFHDETSYEKHDGKIKRYKVVCTECKKFIKWLSNKDTKALGLDL